MNSLSRHLTIAPIVAACLCAATHTRAIAQEEPGPEAAAQEEQTGQPVTEGPFKVTRELTGRVGTPQLFPVVVQPREWQVWVVERAASPNRIVRQGDPILWVKTEKIDERLGELKISIQLAALGLAQAEQEFAALENSAALELQTARQAKRVADAELEYFERTDLARSKENAERAYRRAEHYLEYAEEELNQLKQMYEADDLTEETEEIILIRQQRAVDDARFSLESARLQRTRTLDELLPRREESLNLGARRSTLSLEKLTQSQPVTLGRKALELDKQRVELGRLREQLERLEEDRANMPITAPVAGWLVYGAPSAGTWPDTTKSAAALRPGLKLAPNAVVMTIVPERPLVIQLDLPEDLIASVRPASKAQITPAGSPDVQLPAVVDRISPLPVKPGLFEAVLRVEAEDSRQLLPGTGTKVTFTLCDKQKTITVPADAVETSEFDPEERYVTLLKEDGEEEKRIVKVGQKTAKRVEIVEGLQPGDRLAD